MSEKILSGFRALDLTDEKGFICGKILASLGVETIKVERPGGDPSRKIPPFVHNIKGPENSLYWQAFNTDKLGITLDLTQDQGKQQFTELVARSDFVLESFTPGYLESIGFEYSGLSKINPSIILTSISPFGQKGPYARYKGSELIASAMSGLLLTNGDADRPPVKDGPDTVNFHSNAAAALGTVIAHYHRQLTGEGQQVDVSMQEVTVSRTSINMVLWQFEKQIRRRSGSARREGASTTVWIWPCKDGYLFWSFFGGKMGAPANRAISKWINDNRLDNPLNEIKNWDEFDLAELPDDKLIEFQHAVRMLFLNHTVAEIAVEGLQRGINACVINTPEDVLNVAHLQAREYWSNLKTPENGTIIHYPKYFFLSNETKNFVINRAPRIGEHNINVLSGLMKQPQRTASTNRTLTSGTQQPLHGINVLDFGWAVAGSLVGKYLADHGATVIRIESAMRPDATRTSQTVLKSTRNDPDNKPRFTYYNTSKLSFTLNLKHPESRSLIEKLIMWADIVNENFTPGTLSRLGFSYEHMKTLNPDIIMISGSAYGQTGPLSREWGVDGTGAALSGYMDLTGWPDRMPCSPNGHTGDVMLPLINAIAAVAALDYRQRTGKGQHIDGSMIDTCIHQITPALLDFQVNGCLQTRNGNRISYAAPHGVFPCRGDDRWCAIAVFTDSEWILLCRAMKKPEMAMDTRFSNLQARKTNEDELEKLIASWTSQYPAEELMITLQSEGVTAGVVQSMEDIIDKDPQLKERGFLVPVKHPVIGEFGHPAPPFKLSKTASQIKTSPCLGEHNEYICTKILGMTDSQFVELLRHGVFE
jgi:benzylsuccinate CoA-transferase BbsF subunit